MNTWIRKLIAMVVVVAAAANYCAGLIDYNIDCFKKALQRLFSAEGVPELDACRSSSSLQGNC